MRDCYGCDCEVKSISSNDEIIGSVGGPRLVECLRGMLLAERQASKDAKQDADLLRKKIMELEIKLKKAIELRDRAENKLQILHRKLEIFSTKTAC
ncbi:hypothetical protein MLD38_020258 [Melastoma candidum]|uniref:Uncharacterized protein n=1 Tax=Melastoma candidum TaxID=119954 RepID=A0ACB9QBV0_9MYRT|nr:hypothetical protein MLD38_020258 [Melastoma candidum]